MHMMNQRPLKNKLKKKRFIEAFKRNAGIIKPTCDAVGISRMTYYNWRRQDPAFDEACNDVEDEQGDFVENALLKKVEEGDTAAVIFYCKTKLRKRGYSESVLNQKVVINYSEE